jgi:D-glucuronyl C5-epimerase C-terminus
MNQKNLSYYFDVIKLKVYALYYCSLESIIHKKKLSLNNDINLAQFNIERKPYFYTYSFFEHPDELGNTLIKQDGIYVRHYTDLSNHVNPLIPAYYGLICYNYFLKTNNDRFKNLFLQHADFCLTLINNDGGLPILNDYKKFDLIAPWYSGITQAIVSSLLLRGYLISKNEKYKNYASKTIDFMIDEKRLPNKLLKTINHFPWIEEYPGKSPSQVLNGYCFCIISLFEFANTFRDKRIEKLATEHFHSLLHFLPLFLYKVGIRHNLRYFKFGNINYQALHIFLLYHLYIITGNSSLLEISKRYYKQINWNLFFNFYNIKRTNKPSFSS